MPNLFLDLPVPAGLGPGPSVSTLQMGKDRTLAVSSPASAGSLVVEISNDGGAHWCPLATFNVTDKRQVQVAAALMRTNVTARSAGFSPAVSVSGPELEVKTALLPAPGGNGLGAPVDVSDLGVFCTFCANPGRRSVVRVQVSDDLVDWTDCITLAPGTSFGSKRVTARYMRTAGNAVPVSVGAVADGEADTDELIKVSAIDQVAGYLAFKSIPGTGIDMTVLDPGGNEQLQVSADVPEINAALARGVPEPVRGPINDLGTDDAALAAFDHRHRLELEVEDEGVLVAARPRVNFVGDGVGVIDLPGLDKAEVTIPGAALGNGGAVVLRSLYQEPQVSTSSLTYVDAMAGLSLPVPIDGDYWVCFEGEADNQSAAINIELGISVNSLVAVVAGSERRSRGNANDRRPVITTVRIPGLVAGNLIRVLFRKIGAGPAAVNMYRRNLTIMKVQ